MIRIGEILCYLYPNVTISNNGNVRNNTANRNNSSSTLLSSSVANTTRRRRRLTGNRMDLDLLLEGNDVGINITNNNVINIDDNARHRAFDRFVLEGTMANNNNNNNNDVFPVGGNNGGNGRRFDNNNIIVPFLDRNRSISSSVGGGNGGNGFHHPSIPTLTSNTNNNNNLLFSMNKTNEMSYHYPSNYPLKLIEMLNNDDYLISSMSAMILGSLTNETRINILLLYYI